MRPQPEGRSDLAGAASAGRSELDGEGGREAQVLVPLGVDAVDRDDDPHALVWRLRGGAQVQADVLGAAVLLACVARAAGSDDVVPRVGAAAALGHDVIDVLGRTAAVLARRRLAATATPGPGRGPSRSS